MTFFSGTSGLVLPGKKTSFPTEFRGKSRLAYYATLFNSLEVNSSFYKLPMAATVRKWAEETPGHFKFTFKISKTITQAKGLDFDPELVQQFMERIQQVGEKKGCLLIQFPPSLSIEHLQRLEKLIKEIRKYDPNAQWKIAVEFRNSSWYTPDCYALLEKNHACLVSHDIPKSKIAPGIITADFSYIRFHGEEGRYRGSYSLQELEQYALDIRKLLAQHQTVYFYFNNTMGAALQNLETLNNFLK